MAALMALFIDEGESSRSGTCPSSVRRMRECSPSHESQPLIFLLCFFDLITTLDSSCIIILHRIANMSCHLAGGGFEWVFVGLQGRDG
ncbi:hypothetical protein Tco_0753939 [Tanacetum coccineum]